MKILFDHNVPVQLRRYIPGNLILTARELGLDRLSNGDLLLAAEAAGFELMITGDQNLIYQQKNLRRRIALIVITQTKRALVASHYGLIRDAIDRASPGSYELVPIPRQPLGTRAVE